MLALDVLAAGAIERRAIAPGVLGGIAGHVGLAHQFGRARGFGGDGDDAGTGADVVDPALPVEAHGADAGDELFGDGLGLHQIAVAQQQGEFVAADPRHGIRAAQGVPQQGAQFAQQQIAGGMAGGVVDHLEAIEVDEAQRVLDGPGLGLLPGGVQLLLELQAVVEASQGVVGGVVAQLALQIAGVGDILEHQHRADDAAIHRTHWRGRILHLVPVTLAAEQYRALVQGGDGLLAQAAGHRTGQDLVALAVVDEKHLFVGPAPGIRQRPAGELLGDRIEKEDAPIHVGGQHGVGDGGQGDLQPFLFLVERRGQLVVLGDVAVAADQAYMAVGLDHRDQLGADMAHLAAGAAAVDAEVEGVEHRLAGDLVEHLQRTRLVVRVDEGEPEVHVPAEIVGGNAVEISQPRIGIEARTAGIPFPDADVAGANGQLQPLAEPGVGRLGPALGVDVAGLQQIAGEQVAIIMVGRQRQLHPQSLAVAVQQTAGLLAFLDRQGFFAIGDQLLERPAVEAVARIAEHGLQGGIHLTQAALHRQQRHAIGRGAQGMAKACLVARQALVVVTALLHGGGQQQWGNLHQGHGNVGQGFLHQGGAANAEQITVGHQVGEDQDVQAADHRGTQGSEPQGHQQQQGGDVDEGVGHIGQQAEHQHGADQQQDDELSGTLTTELPPLQRAAEKGQRHHHQQAEGVAEVPVQGHPQQLGIALLSGDQGAQGGTGQGRHQHPVEQQSAHGRDIAFGMEDAAMQQPGAEQDLGQIG